MIGEQEILAFVKRMECPFDIERTKEILEKRNAVFDIETYFENKKEQVNNSRKVKELIFVEDMLKAILQKSNTKVKKRDSFYIFKAYGEVDVSGQTYFVSIDVDYSKNETSIKEKISISVITDGVDCSRIPKIMRKFFKEIV